ncbi:MAG: fumarylacetoacetate hydrolase family protein, partial [Ilumatobacteraceae bacterium]
MKIARFTEGGRTRLGIVATGTDEIIDIGTADPSLPTDVGDLLTVGGLAQLRLLTATAGRLALSSVQL